MKSPTVYVKEWICENQCGVSSKDFDTVAKHEDTCCFVKGRGVPSSPRGRGIPSSPRRARSGAHESKTPTNGRAKTPSSSSWRSSTLQARDALPACSPPEQVEDDDYEAIFAQALTTPRTERIVRSVSPEPTGSVHDELLQQYTRSRRGSNSVRPDNYPIGRPLL